MAVSKKRFSYADYEEAIRKPEYGAVREVSRVTAAKFRGCRRVLDVASGQGFLLDALQQLEIPCVGVDSESDLVRQCQERGLTVFCDDALAFLSTTGEKFDGVNCAHFIEHLPYEAMLDCIEGVERVLLSGGRFILRWPNPRSLVMQHLSFWRDPTHVRYYDGQFIEAVLDFYGFDVMENDYGGTDRVKRVSRGGTPPLDSPSHARRISIGRRLRGLFDGPLNVKPLRKLLAFRDRHFVARVRLRAILDAPLEVEIVAVKRADEGPGSGS